MKDKCFLFLVVLISSFSYGQKGKDDGSSRHELKLNVLSAALYYSPDVSYEYLANENISIGLGLFYKFNRNDPRLRGFGDSEPEFRIYSVSPYLRRFFSKKYARGFFVEGFGMLNSRDVAVRTIRIGDETSENPGETIVTDEVRRFTHFGMGITLGGKFLLGHSGLLLETYFGAGVPGVIGRSGNKAVSRGGISFGYRF